MRLIDHWRTVAWRSATSWVATGLGAVGGALANTYLAAFMVIGFVPSPRWQFPLAALLGAIVIGGPIILARLVEQPKLNEKLEEKKDG